MYLNSIQIIGFLGKDPERRQARANGAAFAVLSVATQRSWKNAQNEWCSKSEWHRVVAWNGLGERVAAALRKGDHVLVEGTLVSTTYNREYGKGKKPTVVKHTLWQVRADSVRKLNRGEKEPEGVVSGSNSDAPVSTPPSKGGPSIGGLGDAEARDCFSLRMNSKSRTNSGHVSGAGALLQFKP
jgi:single-strand DNA-binding protein